MQLNMSITAAVSHNNILTSSECGLIPLLTIIFIKQRSNMKLKQKLIK